MYEKEKERDSFPPHVFAKTWEKTWVRSYVFAKTWVRTHFWKSRE
jgi:hypothetical protein